MSRRLLLLDLVLVVLAGILFSQLRREWIDEHARTAAFLAVQIRPVPARPLTLLARFAPLSAVTYSTVAQQNLFSKDRNPQVIIDVEPPKPKPIPAFPVARGVLLWEGTPPAILLSTKSGGAQRAYRAGDQIGEWKLVSVDNQYVTFEWDGREFKKRIDELMDRNAFVAEAPAPQAGAAPARQNTAAPKPAGKSLGDTPKDVPGVDVGSTDIRGCESGDSTPVGTIQNGFKKVVSATPFGSACRWEQVK